MPTFAVFLALACAKSFVSTSVFSLKYFGINILLAYCFISSLGFVIAHFWRKASSPHDFSKKIWLLNGIRFFMRDAAIASVLYAYLHGVIPRVSALFFTTGFLLPILSRIFLGTKTPLWKWCVLGLGYIGLLVILQPFDNCYAWNFYDILVLLAALGLAASNVLLKSLLKKGLRVVDSLYASNICRMAICFVCLIIFFDDVVANVKGTSLCLSELIGLLVLSALLQNAAQTLHTYAFKWGRIPFLSIMELWRFVFDAAVGYFIFHQMLIGCEVIGVTIILIACIAIACGDAYDGRKEKILQSTKNEL
ncbi:MAG: hypothetical protein OXC30_00380 [Alphaproteobacteria bacterium]|nr:hypothetical protein [Alphaproteobacteria bacterium]